MRNLLSTLEHNTLSLIQEYPLQRETINRWKNYKMHQLMTVQQFLSQKSKRNELNFEKELNFLAEEHFFPELRE